MIKSLVISRLKRIFHGSLVDHFQQLDVLGENQFLNDGLILNLVCVDLPAQAVLD